MRRAVLDLPANGFTRCQSRRGLAARPVAADRRRGNRRMDSADTGPQTTSNAEMMTLSWRISIHALEYSLTISPPCGSPPWSIFRRSGREIRSPVWAVGGLVVWMHDSPRIRSFCVDVASILSRLMAIQIWGILRVLRPPVEGRRSGSGLPADCVRSRPSTPAASDGLDDGWPHLLRDELIASRPKASSSPAHGWSGRDHGQVGPGPCGCCWSCYPGSIIPECVN